MATIVQKTDVREAMPRAYPDLHDHIEALKQAGLLCCCTRTRGTGRAACSTTRTPRC